ncbi:ComF family protein [Balneola sp. MJW-20]|uniref:ComF family protein n=1 Tax=Gracilimonas aurantiaca TaxID=3234185 RepID=UPI003465B61C
MIRILKNIIRGGGEVIFPNICLICGFSLSRSENVICMLCLSSEFEKCSLKPDSEQQMVLPESVLFQYSMWKFDKGGHLQMLLHKLKYDRLTGIGIDTGRMLGSQLMKHSCIMNSSHEVLLIPVPLHEARYKIRGYNQSFLIAAGISEVTGWDIAARYVVQRQNNTKTQTGFDLNRRIKNITDAFRVSEPDKLRDRLCIIVDDVFTTGTTTFELASCIFNECGVKCGIVSIAKA